MSPLILTRRIALLGATSALGGCSAISALNSAAQPLDTFDLSPVAGSKTGRRTLHSLLVARPEALAAIATDRIMVKPDQVSITYLTDARWSEEAPLIVQSLLIRSIADTGRIGYVGRSDGGPVPDTSLLVRMDAFQAAVAPDGTITVSVKIALTVLNDRDQRVIGTRDFAQSTISADDTPTAIVGAFQVVLNEVLPAMADWVLQNA